MNHQNKNFHHIKTLFEAMERTMFICSHNFRLDSGDILHERFWFEYYKDFIDSCILYSLDEDKLNGNENDLKKSLLNGTKCVYDVNVSKMMFDDITQTKPENFVKAMLDMGSPSDKLDEKFNLKVRDNFRNTLEELIKQVFNDPDKIKKMVDEHWESGNMRLFAKQLNGTKFDGITYSLENWREEYHPEALDLIDGMKKKTTTIPKNFLEDLTGYLSYKAFVYKHNYRICSMEQRDFPEKWLFLYHYYIKFIMHIIPLAKGYANSELSFLLKWTKIVYDININLIMNRLINYKAFTDKEALAEHLEKQHERCKEFETLFHFTVRDEYKEDLEEYISFVYNENTRAVEEVTEFWKHGLSNLSAQIWDGDRYHITRQEWMDKIAGDVI